MHGRMAIIVVTFLIGCSDIATPVRKDNADQFAPAVSAFDVSATGAINGRVVWDGPVPAADESLVRVLAYNPHVHQKPARFSTPHVPIVHPRSGGVANAVVYLKNVNPRLARPWDHPKVRVEFHERRMLIHQGAIASGVGFVRRGDTIDVVNRDAEFHILRGRRGAFFAMPLVEANKIGERLLLNDGVVDLTCGAGYYWLHAYLFVTEHPYFTMTDADGRFTLEQVPAGTYDVVCWLPSWHVERKERDPEIAVISRWIWREPREQVQKVRVETGKTRELSYQWASSNFN